MKRLYLAWLNVRSKPWRILFILLQILFAIVFAASSLGTMSKSLQLLGFVDRSGLRDWYYFDARQANEVNLEGLKSIDTGKRYNFNTRPFAFWYEEKKMIAHERDFYASFVPQLQAGRYPESRTDGVMEVVVTDEEKDTFKLGQEVNIYINCHPYRVLVVGIYSEAVTSIKSVGALGQDLGAFFAPLNTVLDEQLATETSEDVRREGGYLFVAREAQESNVSTQKIVQQRPLQSLPQGWNDTIIKSTNVMQSLVFSTILFLLVLAGVLSIKLLRALDQRKQMAIQFLSGARIKDLLAINVLEECILFTPVALLIQPTYTYISRLQKNLMQIDEVAILDNPTMQMIQSYVSPITLPNIYLMLMVFMFLSIFISSVIVYATARKMLQELRR